MNNSRLIIGLIIIVLGIALTIACFFSTFFLLVYSLPLIAIGIIIIFNKKEDEIEQRKDLNKKKDKD